MTGTPRQERVRVRLDAATLEAIRVTVTHAITGTVPAPNPYPLPLALELELEAERLDPEPRRQNVHSNAYENVHAVKFGEGILYGFTAYNSNAASQFIQVFDNSKAPVTGDVPAVTFTVAATTNLGVEWIHGRPFLTGCFIANSTTGPTYTAGANDCFFDVQFV